MCRLFGFSSLAPSSAHRSLVRANNALLLQSKDHPDGWGIGWWREPSAQPELERGAGAAFAENDFERVARMVSASSAIAHVRKASVGKIGIENAHPFRRGRWLFAHNGTLARFSEIRAELDSRISLDLRLQIRGETDSERCFLVFLSEIAQRASLDADVSFEDAAAALAKTVSVVRSITDPGAKEPSSMNFMVGNGRLLLACRNGRTLHYSTYKHACSERSTCARFSPECEAAPNQGEGHVNHFILASEKISEEDVWFDVPEGGIIGVDAAMQLRRLAS